MAEYLVQVLLMRVLTKEIKEVNHKEHRGLTQRTRRITAKDTMREYVVMEIAIEVYNAPGP